MEYVMIGQIINTHGIKGDLKVYPYTEDVERFSDLEKIYIGEGKEPFDIGKVKYHKGMVLLKLKSFDNINEVLHFKEEYLYIDEENIVELPENNYFIDDLIDCNVYDMGEKYIGYVKNVLQNTGNDIYVVKNDDKKEEYLIPGVTSFVKKIDVSNQKILIDPIDGMIEWR